MTGTFDSVATIITDLANATLTVLSTVFTGTNAGTVISAVVVIAVVTILMGIPQKLMGKYFKRD